MILGGIIQFNTEFVIIFGKLGSVNRGTKGQLHSWTQVRSQSDTESTSIVQFGLDEPTTIEEVLGTDFHGQVGKFGVPVGAVSDFDLVSEFLVISGVEGVETGKTESRESEKSKCGDKLSSKADK